MDKGFILVVGIFGMIVLIAFLVWISVCIREFKRELRCLNNEINRTTGSEQRHWIHKKRKLFLSLIPFVKYK